MNAYSLIYVQQILPARIHLVCFRVIVTLVLDILDQFVLVINLNLTIIGWFLSFWQKMPSQGFSYLSKTKAVMREDNTKRDVDNSRYCVKTESYNCIYIYIYIYIYITHVKSHSLSTRCVYNRLIACPWIRCDTAVIVYQTALYKLVIVNLVVICYRTCMRYQTCWDNLWQV